MSYIKDAVTRHEFKRDMTAYEFLVAGETVPRYTWDCSGKHSWGSGSAPFDLTMERDSNGVLYVSGGIAHSGAGAIQLTSATYTLTAAEHANRILTFDRAAGVTCTLPDSAGTGDVYTFFVATTFSGGNGIIKVNNATDLIQGNAYIGQDGADTVVEFASLASNDTITLNGTSTGGFVGCKVVVTDIKTGQWSAQIYSNGSGTEVTPFSATVS